MNRDFRGQLTGILDERRVIRVSEEPHDELAIDSIKNTTMPWDDGREVLDNVREKESNSKGRRYSRFEL